MPRYGGLVNAEELHQWPSVAVKAMKSQRLIIKNAAGCQRDMSGVRGQLCHAGA